MSPPDPRDPVAIAAALIRCRSVTPADGGAQQVLTECLQRTGFAVTDLPFGSTPNLFARWGAGRPYLGFAGHTDVVPPGSADWRDDPFAGAIRDGVLYGRGACDMKGGIAAFAAAAARYMAQPSARGSIGLLITGDEEGEAIDGTARLIAWMRDHGETPDFCLVGEPTNPAALGETIKIGRRGSLNATLRVRGTQGHAAYPQRADNPVHRLVRALADLIATPLDAGSDRFEPSSLQLTSVDVGNPATNVIPAAARAAFNIRFNDLHTGAGLVAWLHARIAPHAPDYTLDVAMSGEAFLTAPGPGVRALASAIVAETGRTPALDTGGGTSDARFIAKLCPVAEFGLVGASMHKVDENVPVAELEALTRIYQRFIAAFMNETPA